LAKKQKLSTTAQSRLQSFEAKQVLETSKATRRKDDNRKALLVSAVVVLVALLAQLSYFSFGPGSIVAEPEASPTVSASPNSADVPVPDESTKQIHEGTMEINGSELEFSLDGTLAPQAVANFLSLIDSGFYNDLSCHRLVTEGIYVLQCGDPNGDGSGGPGYSWGPIENAPEDDLYKTGVLAMARRGGDAASMGSQFFIVYKDSPIPADGVGGYTVFGEITLGLDLLDPIIEGGVEGGGTDGPPAIETVISTIKLK
jgi:peptidyl-prolyl cis-trans isomerase B (cyclophilin B)